METDNMTDLTELGMPVNDVVLIMNTFFRWKRKHMNNDSILEALREFSDKFGYNVIELAQELSEVPGFVDICEQDCRKFKYSIVYKTDNIDSEWELE